MLTDHLPSLEPTALAPPALDDPSLYINRELSWLQFNWRVLDESLQPSQPLLERVKFLAIFAKNLDEFFMIRVAGLRRLVMAGVSQLPPDGMTPAQSNWPPSIRPWRHIWRSTQHAGTRMCYRSCRRLVSRSVPTALYKLGNVPGYGRPFSRTSFPN